eukprot:125360-Pyramimonas_sp.AAC.1
MPMPMQCEWGNPFALWISIRILLWAVSLRILFRRISIGMPLWSVSFGFFLWRVPLGTPSCGGFSRSPSAEGAARTRQRNANAMPK